ncbi:hypothetical protein TBLA_0B07700 [Henningerozyma blattae CBS 6284]|uniref:Signal peptidase complex subunit 1 n=1 Tax=Henningerozyma blattae (strain ATCC 34711 / CBS 6284 / DSM 70876 / NBRC 10599 / NRRL Y-10934 / UCD 77-7) TaxID=1071380 RepID=I2GZN4_HENB6|nr:hypothetical protein TBLA_0B07700 [Tetrapisispora blattae CBS 6284]CCH59586.1 hypothetical protein TBLA_0B07700 [Tetrapisispora blattae CBS 6284]
MLENIGRKLIFPIDFPSQKRTFHLQSVILLISALFASAFGFFTQSLLNLLICYAAGVLITMLLVVPPYPSYNKKKLQWVKPSMTNSSMATESGKITVESSGEDIIIVQ